MRKLSPCQSKYRLSILIMYIWALVSFTSGMTYSTAYKECNGNCNTGDIIDCIDGWPCSIACNVTPDDDRRRRRNLLGNTAGCNDLIIYCPQNAQCNINCNYRCHRLKVYAQTATSLSITRCDNCNDIEMHCPMTATLNGPDTHCKLQIEGDIYRLNVYAQESIYDFRLIQSQSNDILLDNPTMHCGPTTNEYQCILTSDGSDCISTSNSPCKGGLRLTTKAPTNDPTIDPTNHPTQHPTIHPTHNPTNHPTNNPTLHPTLHPTFDPTGNPTFDPTFDPTNNPTNNPTFHATNNPTFNPAQSPTLRATKTISGATTTPYPTVTKAQIIEVINESIVDEEEEEEERDESEEELTAAQDVNVKLSYLSPLLLVVIASGMFIAFTSFAICCCMFFYFKQQTKFLSKLSEARRRDISIERVVSLSASNTISPKSVEVNQNMDRLSIPKNTMPQDADNNVDGATNDTDTDTLEEDINSDRDSDNDTESDSDSDESDSDNESVLDGLEVTKIDNNNDDDEGECKNINDTENDINNNNTKDTNTIININDKPQIIAVMAAQQYAFQQQLQHQRRVAAHTMPPIQKMPPLSLMPKIVIDGSSTSSLMTLASLPQEKPKNKHRI